MERLKKYGFGTALFLILILTGFLTFFQIGNEGFSNTYYSAAVKSMMASWHNFFFASFDPGGFVTVDKPALGLWFQVLSAKIFGFRGWSLILPEALSAVVSTMVVYHLAKRSFGKPTGILSALIFSLTPILIAVSRTNNLDSSLLMVLLLAVWALIEAAERGSLKHLILSMVLVGIGFNIKMLEAYMVLPAFCLVYILSCGLKTGKKIKHLVIATAVLLTISLSWVLAVDLTPSDKRPYVGSSQTNSELNLALGYNGIERITGVNYGNLPVPDGRIGGIQDSRGINGPNPNGQFPGNGDSRSSKGSFNGQPPADGGGSSNFPGDRTNRFSGRNIDDGNRLRGMNGGPGSESENGSKGILRIFNFELAGQIGWLLPLAFFGAAMLFLKMRDRNDFKQPAAKMNFWLWSAWLLPMLAYFSFAGFFHRYYLAMMAPGIAILAGIGFTQMWKAYRGFDWKWILLPAAILVTVSLQCVILSRYQGWGDVLVPIVIGMGIISSLSLIVIRLMNRDTLVKTMRVSFGAGILALLISPAVWSMTPILYRTEATLPYAGPELDSGNNGRFVYTLSDGLRDMQINLFPPMNDSVSNDVISYLEEHRRNEKYIVAVTSSREAAPIIIRTGEPVMAMGGFSGSDNILSVEKLSGMVAAGEVRYFLIQGFEGVGMQQNLVNWIILNGTAVEGFQGLYDLSGASGQPSGNND